MSSRQKSFQLGLVYTLIPDSCCAGFCSHIYNNGDVNVISVTARRSRKCWQWSVTYGIDSVTDFAAVGNLRGKGTEDNIQEVNIQEWGLGFRVNSSRPNAPAQCSMYVNDLLLFRAIVVHTTLKAIRYCIRALFNWVSKTKTKVITTPNQSKGNYQREPMATRSKRV